MSNSPETDANIEPGNNGYPTIPPDFARSLERRLSAALTALAESKRDAERLDWLEGDNHLMSIKATVGGWVFERTNGIHTNVNNGNAGLRAAIDAAMGAQKGES